MSDQYEGLLPPDEEAEEGDRTPAASSTSDSPAPAAPQPTPHPTDVTLAYEGVRPTAFSAPPVVVEVGLQAAATEELRQWFDAGYRGLEPPLGRDRAPRTKHEQAITVAWAKGVWQRQGEAETKRRIAKREEWVKDQKAAKLEVPDAQAYEQARAERAAAYADWERRGRP